MAYCNTSGLADNTLHFLSVIKDFLVNTGGWTLLMDTTPNSPATPTMVFKSNGENGKEDVYISFSKSGSTTNRIGIGIHNYHDGVSAPISFTNSSYLYVGTSDASSFLYWIFSSLDRVFIVTKIGTNYLFGYTGLYKRFWSDQFAQTLAPALSGTNVTIPVDDASIFTAGNSYITRDNTGFEKVVVSAVDTNSNPNTITIASLQKACAAGAKIGEDPQPLCVSYSNALTNLITPYRCDGTVPTDISSSSGTGGKCDLWSTGNGSAAQLEQRFQKATLWPMMFFQNYTYMLDIKGELIETYYIGNNIGACEDIIQIGNATYKIFQGTVFGSGGVFMAVRAS